MDAKTILADLQLRFPRKVWLSPKDLADIIDKSEQAQANLRHRGNFPLPIKKVGRKVGVSIYAVAEWLADEGSTSIEAAANTAPQTRKAKNTVPDRSKPTRSRPSLGASLMALRTAHEFQMSLIDELEKIHLHNESEKAAKKAEKARKKAGDTSPAKPPNFWETNGRV